MKQSKSAESIREALGRNLKTIRISRGYTQAEFAELLGMKQGALSQIEAGVKGFTSETLAVITSILDIPTSALLEEAPTFDAFSTAGLHPQPVSKKSTITKRATTGPLLAADGAAILARLEEISDEQRKFLLALLFEDASLAKGVKIPDLSAFLQSFQKAE